MNQKYLNHEGFTLMEIIVSIGIVMILMLGVYNLISFSLKITADNKYYVEAIEIANQRMEELRNIPYVDVGTASGSPQGIIPDYENISRDGEYIVHTTVIFYDDPYDGTNASGTDTVFVDYKIATIEISWKGRFTPKSITVFSKIIPNTEETLNGYGLLKIYTLDSSGGRIANADIHIENSTHGLSVDLVSGTDGVLSYPVLPDNEGYEITVTKINYGTDKTYERTATNTNPTKPHLSVFDGTKTEEGFTIDKLSTLTIKTQSNNQSSNWIVGDLSLINDSSFPKSSIDNFDNMYFIWQNQNSTSSKIYIQKYDSLAVKQWASDLSIETTNFQVNPDIATKKDGSSFVVWQDNSATLKLIAKNSDKKFAISNNIILHYPHDNDFNIINSDFGFLYQSTPTSLKNNNYSYFKKIPFPNDVFDVISNFFETFNIKAVLAASSNVVFVDSEGATTGNSSNITITKPAGTQEDDLLIAYIHIDDYSDGPMGAPAGWNTINDDLQPVGADNDSRGAIFWKIAGVAEPINYTFNTTGNSTRKAGNIRTYRGIDTSNPFSDVLLTDSTDTNNRYHEAPAHSVSFDGSMLVCGWGTDTNSLGGDTPIIPADMSNFENSFAVHISALSADKSVDLADSPTTEKTFDAGSQVPRSTLSWTLVLKPADAQDDIEISSIGNQYTSLFSSTTNYLGGAFVVKKKTPGSTNITSVTITESGTIDAYNDLANVKLFYDIDSSLPYDCSSEIFDGGEVQYGITNQFSALTSTSTFSDILEISDTKTACFYTVVDILNSAYRHDTIDILISNPSLDIKSDGADIIIPNTLISISSTTIVEKPTELHQIHYRWQYDDNTEALATWDEDQNTPASVVKDIPMRIRFEISNRGSVASPAVQYKLEYGKEVTSCSAITVWESIPNDNSKDWKIIDSIHLTDNNSSTNIANGLTDDNITFIPGTVNDIDNLSQPITLDDEEFSEFLFSVQANPSATDDNYCFRLTDNGGTDDFYYDEYPQARIIGDDNVYIKSIDSNGNTLWITKKINSENSNAEQSLPRIAITENFGAATTSVVWQDYRNLNSDIYLQVFDLDGNKKLLNDLQVTNIATHDLSPVVVIDSNDNIIVAWVDNSTPRQIIKAHKYDLAGNPIWASEKTLVSSLNNCYAPEIAIDNADNIYLTWIEDTGSEKNILFAQFDSSGNENWQNVVNLEESDKNQYSPSIVIKDNIILISWTDDRHSIEDVFAQRYDLSGNTTWTEDLRLNINLISSNQKNSDLLINSTDDFFASWQDDRDGAYNIYASNFVDPINGTPVPNVPIIIKGTKQIGDNPVILEYDKEYITDALGEIIIVVEWDSPGYSFETGSASPLSIIATDLLQPLIINPNENKEIILYVE